MGSMVVALAATVVALRLLQRVVAGAAAAAAFWKGLECTAGRLASDSFQASRTSAADKVGSPAEGPSEQGAGCMLTHGSSDMVISSRSVGWPTTRDRLPAFRPPPSCCCCCPCRCCRSCSC